MALALLSRLATGLKTIASAHKKKLIALLILIVGYKIARRHIKTHTLISIVMFFFKFWSKVMELLPIPVDANFRHIQPFQCMTEVEIPELSNLVDMKQLLLKIKSKEEGAMMELKTGVISSVVLNLILYNATTIYDLVTRKYRADFSDLGAAAEFQQTMALLKVDFLKNVGNFRLFVVNQIAGEVEKLVFSEMVTVKRVEAIFKNLVNRVFSESTDIREKILTRKTFSQHSKQFKVAQNYFKTTKQYIQPAPPSKIRKGLKALFSPATFLLKGISYILKSPEQELSPYRFVFNQYIYILPLKRFTRQNNWPNAESRFLFDRVMEELINFFYSINFSVFSYRFAEFRLRMFVNRLNIYYVKRAKCEQKKLMDLLPIFYKISQQQMNIISRRKDFYQRELISAFKDTRYSLNKSPIVQYKARNRILQQIYYKSELDHLEKDMQAKLYSEREGLTIEPIAQSSRVFEEKDEIQQLMQIHNRANEERTTTREQMQMMRELTD